MSQSEARAWWVEVQDVRETIERRRAAESGLSASHERGPTMPRVAARSSSPAPGIRADRGADVPARGRAAERHAAAERSRPADHLRVVERSEPFDQDAVALAETRRRGGRRTVEITGRTVGAPTLPRLVEIDRRRPAPRAIDRVGARPDRLAMWAVMLGIVLVLAALSSSSHAATPAHAAHAVAHVAAR
jgi:hypothetical protein